MPKEFTGMSFILEPEKETVYATGWQLIGYTFTKQDTQWLLTIKCQNKQGKRMVAFIGGHTVALCYEQWYSAMTSRSIQLKWRQDKFHTN